MKLLPVVIAIWCFASALNVRAAAPEDQYLAIYYLIQQGDSAGAEGKHSEAASRYTDALDSLTKLQKAYPQWETNIVKFRLGYLQRRIAASGGKPVPARPSTVEPASGGDPRRAEFEAQLAAIQAQMEMLQANNASLQAKLREALAVRPAAVDPVQLARAERQVRELSKENDLLKAGLNDAQAKAAASAGGQKIAQLRKEIDEAGRKLAEEKARTQALMREKGDLEDRLSKAVSGPRDNDSLRVVRRQLKEAEQKVAEQQKAADNFAREKAVLTTRLGALEAAAANADILRLENEMLKRQVAELRAASAAGAGGLDLSRRLAFAQTQIAALKSERDILQLERSALEGRVKQLMAAAGSPGPGGSAARTDDARSVKQLEAQVETLKRQLADALRKADPKGTNEAARADALAEQLAGLRLRLEAYEARAVPYLPEELALLRQGSPRLAGGDQPARKNRSSPRPPEGSGPLISEAQQLFARGEYAQAEKKYEEVLRKDDKNAHTLANLGAIQLEQGKFADAEKNLRQALAAAPEDVYTLQTLGYLKFRQNNHDDALVYLSKASELSPDNPEVLSHLGVSLNHKGQRAAAENALRRAIQIEPGYASAHVNLAVVYAAQNPPLVELARWHYQKALAAGHPKNPELEKFFEKRAAPPAPAP